MTLTTRLRSVLSDARERAGVAGDSSDTPGRRGSGPTGLAESDAEQRTTLFECATCDTVYVAVEKSVCSDCGDAVEEVPATLSEE